MTDATISYFPDMAACFQYQDDQYPNKDQNLCIPKNICFLSYEEPLRTGLAIGAFIFFGHSCSATNFS